VRELQHALAVEPDDKTIDEEALVDETLMISVCAGIVTVDQESNIIRLVHYTTEEYFERKRLDNFLEVRWIAMTCLTYLLFDAFQVGYASSDKQMEIRLKKYLFFNTRLNTREYMPQLKLILFCKLRFWGSLC
jgi:hypothetical protein